MNINKNNNNKKRKRLCCGHSTYFYVHVLWTLRSCTLAKTNNNKPKPPPLSTALILLHWYEQLINSSKYIKKANLTDRRQGLSVGALRASPDVLQEGMAQRIIAPGLHQNAQRDSYPAAKAGNDVLVHWTQTEKNKLIYNQSTAQPETESDPGQSTDEGG